MMRPEEKSVIPFPLVIDEMRCNILNSLLGLATKDPMYQRFLEHEGMMEAFMEFGDEISENEHKRGWCPDEACLYPYEDEETATPDA